MTRRILMCLLALMTIINLAACNEIDKELKDKLDNLSAVDPYETLLNKEELINKVVNTGKSARYSVSYMHDYTSSSTTLTFKNNGEDAFHQVSIVNKLSDDNALVLDSITEHYYDNKDKVLYTISNGETSGEYYTPKLAPHEISLQKYMDAQIGEGFWEELAASFVNSNYDVAKNEYILNSFHVVRGEETILFEGAKAQFSGNTLSRLECTVGPQRILIQIADVNMTLVDLPSTCIPPEK